MRPAFVGERLVDRLGLAQGDLRIGDRQCLAGPAGEDVLDQDGRLDRQAVGGDGRLGLGDCKAGRLELSGCAIPGGLRRRETLFAGLQFGDQLAQPRATAPA
jgi:hypothetical protein